MADVISTLADNEVSVRFREPQLTESINKKALGAIPAGIYRGFNLVLHANPYTVQVNGAEAPDSDHVAVLRNSAGHTLTARRTTSTFLVVLPASYENKNAVIALVPTYAVGTTTTVQIRAYTDAEYDAFTDADKKNLAVLGTVVVGVAGAILATGITHQRRNEAWEELGKGVIPWSPLLLNNSFDLPSVVPGAGGNRLSATPFWEAQDGSSSLGGNGKFTTPTTAGGVVGGGYGKFEAINTTANRFDVFQYVNAPIREGQYLRYRFYKRCMTAATGGTFQFYVEFGDSNGAVVTTVTETISLAGADGSYVLTDKIIRVPTNVFSVKRAGFKTTVDLTVASAPSDLTRIDEVQLFIDSDHALRSQKQLSKSAAELISRSLTFDGGGTPSLASPVLRPTTVSVRSEQILEGGRRDHDLTLPPPLLEWLGRMRLSGALLGSAAEAAQPRLRTQYLPTTTTWTLLHEIGDVSEEVAGTSTKGAVRIYVGGDSEWALTTNALWGGASWSKDVVGLVTSAVRFKPTTGRYDVLGRYAADAGTWTDTIGTADPAVGTSLWRPASTTQAGTLELGKDLVSSLFDANLPRVKTAVRSSDDTLIWESSGASQQMRMYIGSAGTLKFTINAKFNVSTLEWNKDNNGNAASMFFLGINGLTIYGQESAADTWTTWTEHAFIITSSNELPHTLLNGKLTLGTDSLGTAAEAAGERLLTWFDQSYTYTLLWRIAEADFITPDAPEVRFYAKSDGTLAITTNANWNSGTSQWDKTSGFTTDPAQKIEISNTGIYVQRRTASAGSWADNAWTDPRLVTPSMVELGSDLLGSAADAYNNERLRINVRGTTTDRTAVAVTLGSKTSRWYATGAGGTEITQDAFWDGSDWTRSAGATPSSKLQLEGGVFRVLHQSAGGSDTWADSAWDAPSIDTSLNPAHTVAAKNVMYASNAVKAYGAIDISGGAVDAGNTDGFNFSVAINTTTDIATVTFASAMASDDYAVVGATHDGIGVLNIQNRTTTTFQLFWSDDPWGAKYDLATAAVTASFIVCGKQ